VQVARHVDGPELRPYTSIAQSDQIGLKRALPLGYVEAAKIAVSLIPQSPRQVIVPIDERYLFQELFDFLLMHGGMLSAPPACRIR
jgi:hypothetical protein